MTTTKQVKSCNLTPEAIEGIERIFYKSGDDLAVSVARSFERMEERIDAMESRLYNRLADLEDKMVEAKEPITARRGRKALTPSLEKAGTAA
jgi:uncharacterized protein Yka (UPF0111/DUF47 family)